MSLFNTTVRSADAGVRTIGRVFTTADKATQMLDSALDYGCKSVDHWSRNGQAELEAREQFIGMAAEKNARAWAMDQLQLAWESANPDLPFNRDEADSEIDDYLAKQV